MRTSRRALPACAAVRGATSGPADWTEVRAPYYALQDVAVHGPGHVTARVSPEQRPTPERGVISAAEALRHMSVAGSLACAVHAGDPERRDYYVAECASLSAPGAGIEAALPPSAAIPSSGRGLCVTARHVHSSLQEALADCQLHAADGALLFGLRMTYRRWHAAIFQRVFDSRRVEMRRAATRAQHALSAATVRRLRQNPYRCRLEVRMLEESAELVHGELAAISAESCAGHFAQYPTLPLSGLFDAFSSVAYALLCARGAAEQHGYRIHDAQCSQTKPVFAGHTLSIQARALDAVPPYGLRVRLQACVGGDEVASMTASVSARA